MIIIYTLLVAICYACNSLNDVESINLENGESQELCYKLNTKLPTIIQIVKYEDLSKKKKKKKSEEELQAENIIVFEEIKIDSCTLKSGQRICYFESGNDKIDADLKCTKGPCKFNIKVMQESVKNLEIGKQQKSKLKFLKLEKQSAERIIYQIKCNNCIMKIVDADLAFYGEQPTIVESDTKFLASFLQNIEKETIMILVGEQEFDIEMFKYDKLQTLKQNKALIDVAQKNIKNIYKFDGEGVLKLKSSDFEMLKIKVKSDDMTMFDQNYNLIYKRNFILLWNSEYTTIEITCPREASYQLEMLNSEDVIQIEGSQLVLGEKYEIINFKLKIQEVEKQYFSVSVDSEDDSKLSIKQCKSSKCEGFEKVKNEETFNTIEQKCDNPDKDGNCWFMVGVESNGKFSLSVEDNNEPYKLKENTIFNSEIDEEQKSHFEFTLVNPDLYSQVIFRVTSENVLLLVGRATKCKLATWKCSDYSGTSEMPIRLSESNMKEGIYSITVEGMELTKYGLIVETHLKDKINLITIYKGQIHQSSLTSQQSKQCYKYNQPNKNVLTFLVHGPNHKLISYAYIDENEEIPTVKDYDIINVNSALQMMTDKFIACVQIQDEVFEQSNSTHFSEFKYSIVLYDSQSVINLEFNSAYYGQVAFTELQRFSFLTYFDQDIVYITKNILSSGDVNKDLQVYIGNMLYEKLEDYEYKFFDNNVSTYVMNAEKMKKLCDLHDDDDTALDNERMTQTCEIFLVVKSISKTPVRYTLTVHKQDLAIQLTDGLQQTYNLQHIEEFMHFYYQPNSQQEDIYFMAQTYYGKFVIHINLWQMDEKSHKYDWPFIDDEESSDTQSGQTNQVHRTIKSEALNQCWPNCVLLITIQSVKDNKLEILEYNDQFHIMIGQGIQDIIEGQKYEISVKHDEAVFFTFKNLQKFKNDAYLTFSLLQLVGNGYFTITVNGGEKMEYPNLYENYDFHSDGAYLQISRDQFNDVLQSKQISIQDAYLLIAVNGLSSYMNQHQLTFKFELTVQYMNMDYIQVMHSQPYTITARATKPTIVQFYNYLKQDIFIKLQKFLGYGSMSVFRCKEKNTIADCIQESNEDDFKYLEKVQTAGNVNSQILIQYDDKEKFCIYCTYLIKIESYENELHGQLIVALENDFIKIPAGTQYSDYVEKSSSSQFSIIFSQDSQIEIIIQIFTGNPQIQYSFDQSTLNSSKIITAKPNSKYIHITVPSLQLLNQIEDIMDVFSNKTKRDDDDEVELQQLHFMHDELFVKVSTKDSTPCNYTIFYTSELINGKLQDGRIHLAVVKQNSTFLYESYANVNSILNLSPYNQTNLDDIEIDIVLIKKQSFDANHYSESENITLVPRQFHPLSRSYELPKDSGIFEITLKNKKFDENNAEMNQAQILEISVSTKDIQILPIQHHHSGYLAPQNIDYFETYAPSEGYIALELYSCQSDIKFGFTESDLQSLINEDYDEEFSVPDRAYHVEMINIKKGTLFVAVESKSSTSAYYHISNHFYKQKKDIPFGKILAGNDGQINWKFDKQKPDAVQIEFEHASCNKCNLKNIQIDYHIFIAQDDKKLQMLGYCQNEQFENHKANNDQIFKKQVQSYRLADHNGTIVYEIEFPNLVTYEYASIGVMATIDNFMNQTSQIKVFYRTIQVPVPNYLAKIMNKNRTFFTFIIIGMIFLISLLTLWLCYYIKRYRKTRSQLNFQLEQGAKIIAASKIPANDDAAFENSFKMKYENLEED